MNFVQVIQLWMSCHCIKKGIRGWTQIYRCNRWLHICCGYKMFIIWPSEISVVPNGFIAGQIKEPSKTNLSHLVTTSTTTFHLMTFRVKTSPLRCTGASQADDKILNNFKSYLNLAKVRVKVNVTFPWQTIGHFCAQTCTKYTLMLSPCICHAVLKHAELYNQSKLVQFSCVTVTKTTVLLLLRKFFFYDFHQKCTVLFANYHNLQ